MKFCDKLAKLRKNNNLSQEQLADRLGVSRQAVSKWESGTSHPDMEKIIEMCKILNCTLDELMDDDIVGENYKNLTSNEKKNYFKDFLDFITRTYNMFYSMNFKEKMKCIFELVIIILILTLIGTIILDVLSSVIFNLFAIIPYEIRYHLTNIIDELLHIIIIILTGVITFHLFKIRYLDYYVTIEDQNAKEKSIEKPIEQEILKPEEKEKIIIRDPKHSTYSFMNIIAKMISILVKTFSGLIILLLTIIFILVMMFTVIMVYHLSKGEIFIFITVIGVGILTILFMGIKILYNFIFKIKTRHKIMFPIFILCLVLIGIGSGLTFTCLTTYKKVDNFEDLEKYEHTEMIILENNFDIFSSFNTEFKIDNSLENKAKILISAPKGVDCRIYDSYSVGNSYYSIYVRDINYSDIYNTILKDLQNKQYRNYNNLRDYVNVTIYINEENYNKLITRYPY